MAIAAVSAPSPASLLRPHSYKPARTERARIERQENALLEKAAEPKAKAKHGLEVKQEESSEDKEWTGSMEAMMKPYPRSMLTSSKQYCAVQCHIWFSRTLELAKAKQGPKKRAARINQGVSSNIALFNAIPSPVKLELLAGGPPTGGGFSWPPSSSSEEEAVGGRQAKDCCYISWQGGAQSSSHSL
ncbi:hypothetical protein K491DRAFT_721993 [Lophiostoma macrostomum CBS 122681]|uniref:Uncharacterized protein n=1 Tax=Lophiostoma macrostomum CBS 122681 TaxID=1314788 RepID=A0A6A6SMD5_9PLEO|nr:hypothetical protein K491DRAFT_721993 [Lophiostoma macrostomum CBS 122681]